MTRHKHDPGDRNLPGQTCRTDCTLPYRSLSTTANPDNCQSVGWGSFFLQSGMLHQ